MRAILAFVLLAFLLHGPAAAAPKVIARGMRRAPVAIVCPDFRALQRGFLSFSARHAPPPEYFGCTQVPPGTVMTVIGADPGGAPVVSVRLPDGRAVRGVTMNGMIEPFMPNPNRVAAVPPRPASPPPHYRPSEAAPPPPHRAAEAAPPPPDRADEPAEAQPPSETPSGTAEQLTDQPRSAGKAEPAGNQPVPPMENSKDTLCGPDKQCTDEEFSSALGIFKKRWARMPDWLQNACADKTNLPAVDKCIASETSSWAHKNPDKETPWMFPPDMLD